MAAAARPGSASDGENTSIQRRLHERFGGNDIGWPSDRGLPQHDALRNLALVFELSSAKVLRRSRLPHPGHSEPLSGE